MPAAKAAAHGSQTTDEPIRKTTDTNPPADAANRVGWSKAEDDALRTLLEQYGLKKWSVIASALNPHWSRHLEQIGPMSAGLSIQATAGLRSLPLAPWPGLGVLALWAAGALLAGAAALRLRDA